MTSRSPFYLSIVKRRSQRHCRLKNAKAIELITNFVGSVDDEKGSRHVVLQPGDRVYEDVDFFAVINKLFGMHEDTMGVF